MDELQKLEYLSLVSKVCTELDNHYGMNDKDLAEFIISLAEKNTTFEAFKKVLGENGAEFEDSFVANLLRLIQKMRPKPEQPKEEEEVKAQEMSDLEIKKKLFPGLALPNESRTTTTASKEGDNTETNNKSDKDVADSMMADLEAMMNSAKSGSKPSKKSRRSSRSRSRSRSRDRDRDRKRDRKKREVAREIGVPEVAQEIADQEVAQEKEGETDLDRETEIERRRNTRIETGTDLGVGNERRINIKIDMIKIERMAAGIEGVRYRWNHLLEIFSLAK